MHLITAYVSALKLAIRLTHLWNTSPGFVVLTRKTILNMLVTEVWTIGQSLE